MSETIARDEGRLRETKNMCPKGDLASRGLWFSRRLRSDGGWRRAPVLCAIVESALSAFRNCADRHQTPREWGTAAAQGAAFAEAFQQAPSVSWLVTSEGQGFVQAAHRFLPPHGASVGTRHCLNTAQQLRARSFPSHIHILHVIVLGQRSRRVV